MNSTPVPWPHAKPFRRPSLAICIALLGLLDSGLRADPQATIRFQKRNYYPLTGPTTSTFNNERIFDDFSLTTAEKLTGVGWLGVYLDTRGPQFNPPTPKTETFEISIYADDNGRPGEMLFRESQAAAEVETTHLGDRPWAPDPSLHSYYSFKMEFKEISFIAQSGQNYWLSIHSYNRNNAGQPLFAVLPGISDSSNFDYQAAGSYLDPGSVLRERNGTMRDGERKSDLGMRLYGVPVEDADADGMLDSWERAHQLDPESDDSLLDPDGDGLNNLGEFELGCDPHHPDSDRDGLSDGVESDTRVFVDGNDTGSSPLSSDTDRDGLSDTEEVNGSTVTNPNLADSDSDGYLDSGELKSGSDPHNPEDHTAPRILESLGGGDLTDIENDGDSTDGSGFDAVFDASHKPDWGSQEAFRLFDNENADLDSQWYDENAQRYLWATATFPEPFVLRSFALTSGMIDKLLDPSEWEIHGSMDGETFEPIFRWNDQLDSIWTNRNQTLLFEAGIHFRKPKAYTTFRFLSVYTLGDQRLQLGELELFGSPLPPQITKSRKPQGRFFCGHTRICNGFIIEWKSRPGAKYQIEGSGPQFNREDPLGALRTWSRLHLPEIISDEDLSSYQVNNRFANSAYQWFRVVRLHGGANPQILDSQR